MTMQSLDPIDEVLQQLPKGWFDGASIPPNTPSAMKYGRVWRSTPSEIRATLVSEVQSPAALFVLWTWELDPALRVEIVRALGRGRDPVIDDVLKTIFREEPPDEAGRTVRRAVVDALEQQATPKAGSEPREEVSETRGSIRNRGAAGPALRERNARGVLSELEKLKAAVPRFTT